MGLTAVCVSVSFPTDRPPARRPSLVGSPIRPPGCLFDRPGVQNQARGKRFLSHISSLPLSELHGLVQLFIEALASVHGEEHH